MRVLAVIFWLIAGTLFGALAATLLMVVPSIFIADTPMLLRKGVLTTGAVLGCGLGVRRGLMSSPAEPARGVHGSAMFGRAQDARRSLGAPDCLIIGRAERGWLMGYGGDAHLLTIAPTRSGKGVGAIIPNLLTLDRSIICVDPKGENARIAARARRRFGEVFVLDPFEASGLPTDAFNPLAALTAGDIDLAENAALIAEALVYDPPGQVGEAHWNEEAKALIAGLIMHVVTSSHPGLRTLATVREMLTEAPERFASQLRDMQLSPAAGGLIARAANRHLGKSDREAAGVLSSAQRHTHFLDSPRMSAALSRSDFSFAELKLRTASVFLVLPPDRLATHARWLRLLIAQAINELARSPSRTPMSAGSVLFMLDEFAALGRLEPIERAFGLMAGYGVQLWAIMQDLHQLKSLYGERAGTFLSNAGLTQIFNVADIDTATWISRSLGSTTQAYETTSKSNSQSFQHWSATLGNSTNLHLVKRDLMTPGEVMQMSRDHLLLLRPGELPLVARKVRYFREAEFEGLFDV